MTNERRELESKIANLEHVISGIEKDNKKLQKVSHEQERELKSYAKAEHDLRKSLTRLESEYKAVDKKYSKSKKYARELEDQLISKDEKIK
jgi:chromosome segregation ATPase